MKKDIINKIGNWLEKVALGGGDGGDYRPEGVYLNQGSLQREKLRAYVLCSEERTIK